MSVRLRLLAWRALSTARTSTQVPAQRMKRRLPATASASAVVLAAGAFGGVAFAAAPVLRTPQEESCLVDSPDREEVLLPVADAGKAAAAIERREEGVETTIAAGPEAPADGSGAVKQDDASKASSKDTDDDPYSTLEAEPEDQWPETDCGMCIHMRGGPCRAMWRRWERCIDLAKDRGDEVTDHCAEMAYQHSVCAARDLTYYGAAFDAVGALDLVLDEAERQGYLKPEERQEVKESVKDFRKRVEEGLGEDLESAIAEGTGEQTPAAANEAPENAA